MPRKNQRSYETENKIFPTRLREAMDAAGMNQNKLAKAIGVQRQTISNYTLGQSSPDCEVLAKIASALNVSTDYLVGLAKESSPNLELAKYCEYTGLSEKSVERVKQLLILQQSSVGDNIHTMLNLLLESHKLESLLRDLCRFNDAVSEFQYNTAIANSVPVLDRMDENVRYRKYLLTQQFEQLVDSVIHSNDVLDKYHENRGRMIEAMFNGANEKEMESNESSES